MNNEDEARKIAEQSKEYFYHNEQECGLACALRMARWKDEQVKEYLQDKIKEFDGNAIFQITQYNLIEEIYMDLFGKKIPSSNPYTK